MAVGSEYCASISIDAVIADVVAKGGIGGINLASACLKVIQSRCAEFRGLYDYKLPIKEKIHKIATKIYGAAGVTYTKEAENDIKKLNSLGFSKLPINIAKTHLSLSDDAKRKGSPHGWKLRIKKVALGYFS